MTHWTDDPKILELMTHLGKTGKTGKPTRSAYFAEQVKRLLAQVEGRMAERRKVAGDEQALTAAFEEHKSFVSERIKRENELRQAHLAARHELLTRDPGADTAALNREAAQALAEFNERQRKAGGNIEELTKSITMKRTAMRRIDDRIEHYRKQVYAVLHERENGGSQAAA